MRIDILTGGISSERHIALESAKHLYEWIQESGYDSRIWTLPEERDIFVSTHHQDDIVIPIYHGIYGEDGIIQGFLEVMGIPYLGPRVGDHALCIDKYRTNLIVSALTIDRLSTPMSWRGGEWSHIDIESNLSYIVKPNTGGSSDGISIYSDIHTLGCYMSQSVSGNDLIIQEFIGGREFTVGVYGTLSGEVRVLPIIEILQGSHQVFGYEEKYKSTVENEVFVTDSTITNQLSHIVRSIYQHIGLSSIVRMDFRYGDGVFYFLEINTIPGFTRKSLIPKMWEQSNQTHRAYIEMLLSGDMSKSR